MTRREDIATAAALGVDAVGLIFVGASPRSLDLARARELRAVVPPLMTCVALVMNESPARVAELVAVTRPHLLQFHGHEAEPDCLRAATPYLKALAMGEDDADAATLMAGYPSASGFVLDSHAAGGSGGSGAAFDWRRWPTRPQKPLLLAGGLNPDNVYEAVRRLRPFAVDVASGVERSPGIKCPDAMAALVAEVRRADQDAAPD